MLCIWSPTCFNSMYCQEWVEIVNEAVNTALKGRSSLPYSCHEILLLRSILHMTTWEFVCANASVLTVVCIFWLMITISAESCYSSGLHSASVMICWRIRTSFVRCSPHCGVHGPLQPRELHCTLSGSLSSDNAEPSSILDPD